MHHHVLVLGLETFRRIHSAEVKSLGDTFSIYSCADESCSRSSVRTLVSGRPGLYPSIAVKDDGNSSDEGTAASPPTGQTRALFKTKNTQKVQSASLQRLAS